MIHRTYRLIPSMYRLTLRYIESQDVEDSPQMDQLNVITHYPRDGVDRDPEDENGVGRRYPPCDRKAPVYFSLGLAKTARGSDIWVGSKPKPSNVREALEREDTKQWKQAIELVIESLGNHGALEFVKKPEGTRPLSTRFVCCFDNTVDKDQNHMNRSRPASVTPNFWS